MERLAAQLMGVALEAALLIALPLVAAVALVGIAAGVAQTLVQVQDQNVSFLPKLLAVAALIAFGGAPGLAVLVALFRNAAAAAARLAMH